MKLIFIRHTIAEGKFSHDSVLDFERELTNEGEQVLRKVMKQFKKFEPKIDVIFSSPLARAVQSAEIIWESYQSANLELMADLDILDNPQNLSEYISFLPTDGTYAFVGHDPHLTRVIASILSLNPEHHFLKIKKAGICVLEGGMWEGFRLELLINPKFLKAVL